jgi:hypothetical protein
MRRAARASGKFVILCSAARIQIASTIRTRVNSQSTSINPVVNETAILVINQGLTRREWEYPPLQENSNVYTPGFSTCDTPEQSPCRSERHVPHRPSPRLERLRVGAIFGEL